MEELIAFAVYGKSYVPKSWNKRFGLGVNHVYYVHSGAGGYEEYGVKKPFEAGRIYFFPVTAKALPYSDEADPVLHTYCDFELVPPILSSEVFCFQPKTAMDLAALKVFESGGEFASERRAKGEPCNLPKKSEELFRGAVSYLVARATENAQEAVVRDEEILRAMSYMHANLHRKISVAEIASAAYLSEGGLMKKFKKTLGTTPHAYLRKLRLRLAESLKESNCALEEIAERTGYSDAAALLHALQKERRKSDA